MYAIYICYSVLLFIQTVKHLMTLCCLFLHGSIKWDSCTQWLKQVKMRLEVEMEFRY